MHGDLKNKETKKKYLRSRAVRPNDKTLLLFLLFFLFHQNYMYIASDISLEDIFPYLTHTT
jgi:hypothetical protein